MFFYIVLFISIFLLAVVESVCSIKNKKQLFIIVSGFLWILSFIRWECGTDWPNYYTFFDNNNSLEQFLDSPFETGFAFLNYIVKLISDEYTLILLIQSIIIFTCIYSTIWKYCKYPFFALLFLLLFERAGIFFVRQTIAVAIAIYSIRYIETRSLIPFLISIIIASLFHQSILIFLPAYWVFHLKLGVKRFIMLFILSVIIVSISMKLMSALGSIIGGRIGWKIEGYIMAGDETYGATTDSIQVLLIKALINKGFFLLIFSFVYFKCNVSSFLRGCINLYYFGTVIYFAVLPVSFGLVRLANVYEDFCILAMGILVGKFSKASRPFVVMMLGLYVGLRFYMSTLVGDYSYLFIPYKTFLAS